MCWERVTYKTFMEVAARRVLTMKVSSQQGITWEDDFILERICEVHDITECFPIHSAMRKNKSDTEITALPHRNAKGAGPRRRCKSIFLRTKRYEILFVGGPSAPFPLYAPRQHSLTNKRRSSYRSSCTRTFSLEKGFSDWQQH